MDVTCLGGSQHGRAIRVDTPSAVAFPVLEDRDGFIDGESTEFPAYRIDNYDIRQWGFPNTRQIVNFAVPSGTSETEMNRLAESWFVMLAQCHFNTAISR